MPTISWFYGIAIRMFFNDHAPPHFHAVFGEHQAKFDVATGDMIGGSFPRRQQRLVREWTLRYHAELMSNWDRSRAGRREPLERIPGLDVANDN